MNEVASCVKDLTVQPGGARLILTTRGLGLLTAANGFADIVRFRQKPIRAVWRFNYFGGSDDAAL